MKTSVCMDEIRKIRDENSERHLKMTADERKQEEKEVLEWFAKVSKKPLNIVES
jgi:hypothetical protein